MQLGAIRFGWSKASPPEYVVTLKRGDLLSEESRDDFVARVGQKMAGKGDDVPRFVLIPNAKTVLRSAVRVRQFQKWLMQSLVGWLKEHHPDVVRARLKADREFNEQRGYMMYQQDLEGYGFTEAFGRKQQTAKPLHFDMQIHLASMAYGPYTNVVAGRPLLADVRQYCKDNGLTLSDITTEKEKGVIKNKPEHYQRIREDYTIVPTPFNPNEMPLVFFLNHYGAKGGLAHGATRPRRIDKTLPGKRPLHYVSFVTRGLEKAFQEPLVQDRITVFQDPMAYPLT